MADKKAIWLLDQRFDFLLPSFEKYYKISEDNIQFIGSYHGTRSFKNKNTILGAEKGHVAYQEPEEINKLCAEKFYGELIDSDVVIPFSGAYLPEQCKALVLTGEKAANLNNKWEQYKLFDKIGVRSPRTVWYPNGIEMLEGIKKEFSVYGKLIIKKPELSGGYKMAVISFPKEVREYCNAQNEEFLSSGFIISEYIEHRQSFAGMGVIGRGKKVIFCGATEQVLYNNLAYEGLIWPPFIDEEELEEIEQITLRVGMELAKSGYYGYYNVDFVQGKDGLYAVEINARFGFGTILYALYCGEDFWDVVQGSKDIVATGKESNRRIIIGKIKGREGKGYSGLLNDPKQSDIIKWFNEDRNSSYRKYFLGTDKREIFDYGSFIGLFGESLDFDVDRDEVLKVFWFRCLEQYGQPKTLLSMHVDNYTGISKTTFNFDAQTRYEIKSRDDIMIKTADAVMLPKDFWGSNVSALTLLIGENGSGKTSLMRLLIKWLCQLSVGHIPDDNGALVIRDGTDDKLILFYDGQLHKPKHGELLQLLPVTDKKAVAEMLSDIHLVYYTDTMTDLALENRLTDTELGFLTDYSLLTRLSQYYKPFSADDVPKKSLKRGEFNRQMRLFLNRLQAGSSESIKLSELFPLRYVKLTIVSPADELVFHKLERSLGDRAVLAKGVLVKLWQSCFPEKSRNDDIPLSLTWGLFTGVITSLLIWEKELSISGDDTILGILETSLGMHQANTFLSEYDKLSDIFHNLYFDCKRLFSDSKYKTLWKNTWDNCFLKGIPQFIAVSTQNKALWARRQEDGRSVYGAKIFIFDLKNPNCEKGFRDFWKSYEIVSDYISGCEFDWNYPSSGEVNTDAFYTVFYESNTINHPFKSSEWLIFDEPNNTFHPGWQRRLIHGLTELCKLKKENYSKYQFIVSTHSPIIATDVPKQAAIFLKKQNDTAEYKAPAKNTFAQQIYTLYDNAFFMDEGAIGEFAKNKINNAYRSLNEIEDKLRNIGSDHDIVEIEQKLEDIRRTVELIGEPLVGGLLRQSIRLCETLLRQLKHEIS